MDIQIWLVVICDLPLVGVVANYFQYRSVFFTDRETNLQGLVVICTDLIECIRTFK